MNAHRANPRPAAKEMIAANAAPPAPTGAMTLPTQLIRFSHVPSGCAPVWPWTATFVCGADPRFCAINPASITSRVITRATGSACRNVLRSLIRITCLLFAPHRLGACQKSNPISKNVQTEWHLDAVRVLENLAGGRYRAARVAQNGIATRWIALSKSSQITGGMQLSRSDRPKAFRTAALQMASISAGERPARRSIILLIVTSK